MVIKDIFDNVNNWLKFAEAKNGVIIVLNSTLIFGILKLFFSLNTENLFRDYYIYGIIFLLTTSIITSILSFIPRLNYPYIKFEKPSKNDNLIYFGDISKYNDNQYYEKIKKLINNEQDDSELNRFYINQMIINSKITVIKFKQFEIAIWLILSAILTPIGAFILYIIRD